MNILRFFRVCK